ncbi:MAG TPA: META domain-containing protein [Gaiellaceae bacterium]|nr:META domain-containing protein [Gaiellaceae bacterium]
MPAGEPVAIAYTEWALVELDGEPVAIGSDELAPGLALDLEESRVSGSGGVNRFTGTFSMSENELRFGPLASTRMAGPEDAMRLEDAFFAALARVTSHQLEGRALTLLADGEPVVRLEC